MYNPDRGFCVLDTPSTKSTGCRAKLRNAENDDFFSYLPLVTNFCKDITSEYDCLEYSEICTWIV